MKRLFCAVHIEANQQIRELLQSIREDLSHEHIRWVQPHNLHLTLKFFGDTPPGQEEQIKKAIERIPLERSKPLSADTSIPSLPDNAGDTLRPFPIEIRSCGLFGPARVPRVIWLGVEDGGGLKTLYQRLNKVLEPLGLQPDKRDFTPHLTIGRIKQVNHPERLKEVIALHKNTSFGSFVIRDMMLYQSILRPEGPQYKCLQSVRWL